MEIWIVFESISLRGGKTLKKGAEMANESGTGAALELEADAETDEIVGREAEGTAVVAEPLHFRLSVKLS